MGLKGVCQNKLEENPLNHSVS